MAVILPLILWAAGAPPAVTLTRKFVAGERASYRVAGRLTAERSQRGLETAFPQDIDLSYGFSYVVQGMKADGFAVLRYERPTFTSVEGAFMSQPERRDVEKLKEKMDLTVSPLNEIIDRKIIKAKWLKGATMTRATIQGGALGGFVNELRRLALFVGGLDSSLDFTPRFPIDAVKPGDTWKKTVGYQPQKLSGKGDKQAVQRIDYLYTYRGDVKLNGKTYRRVTAEFALDTDLAAFFNQAMDVKPEESGLRKIPMKMKASIEFNLDLKTNKTMSAFGKSEGGYEVFLSEDDDPDAGAVFGETMKGNTRMLLVDASAKPIRKRKG